MKHIGLISMLCYNYWCETPKEKSDYLNILNENEKQYQKELEKLYNSNNLFKKSQEDDTFREQISNETSLVKIEKETWYRKIIGLLKKIFKRN